MTKWLKYLKVAFIAILVLLIIIVVYGKGFGTRHDYPEIQNGKSLIFAHRGAMDIYVQNSPEAFERSQEKGFKGIETDIRLTKDGKVIIFHDADCNRLLGIDTLINQMNWKDIRKLRLITEKGEKTDSKILILEDFLGRYAKNNIIYLDMKISSYILADSLLQILPRINRYDNILVADENIKILLYLKFHNSKIKTVYEYFNKGDRDIENVLLKRFKPDYYSDFLYKIDDKRIQFLKDYNLMDKYIAFQVTSRNLDSVRQLGLRHVIIDYDTTLVNYQHIEQRLLYNE